MVECRHGYFLRIDVVSMFYLTSLMRSMLLTFVDVGM